MVCRTNCLTALPLACAGRKRIASTASRDEASNPGCVLDTTRTRCRFDSARRVDDKLQHYSAGDAGRLKRAGIPWQHTRHHSGGLVHHRARPHLGRTRQGIVAAPVRVVIGGGNLRKELLYSDADRRKGRTDRDWWNDDCGHLRTSRALWPGRARLRPADRRRCFVKHKRVEDHGAGIVSRSVTLGSKEERRRSDERCMNGRREHPRRAGRTLTQCRSWKVLKHSRSQERVFLTMGANAQTGVSG